MVKTMSGAPIQFYFDFVSPYAYFGATQIERIAARYCRSVDWRPVLIGVTVMKVMGLKPLTETPLKRDYLSQDAPRMARLLGVPFQYHGHKGLNSLAACRAFLWIKERDERAATAFALQIFRRLWVEGVDITPARTVAMEAVTFGFPLDEVEAAIGSPVGKERLSRAVELALTNGVFGVPYFIADGEPIWGSDRLWMLEHWLAHGSWERQPS
jgi:2-hydroxychromene-2-carboxylate isomerase